MKKLPLEIALDILSRLSITCLIRVKCVCTSWRMLAQHPLLPPLNLSRMAQTDPSLLLLSHCPNFENSFYNIQTLTRNRLPTLINPRCFSVAVSCNGLLCLWDSLQQVQAFICNPFTSDCIELPESRQFPTQHRVASGFGFHSLKNEYKVVRIVYYRTNEVGDSNIRIQKPVPEAEIEVLTIGDGILTWRNKGKTSYQVLGRPSNVTVEERIHWLTCKYRKNWDRKIICFDLGDEQLREIPSPRAGMFGRHCTNLVNLRGCLSAVVQGYRSLYIWVMKEYGIQDSWIKEYTISIPDQQLNPYADQSINSDCFPLNLSQLRVLCLVGNGEIVLQHRGRYLVAFDPNSGILRQLEISGLPEDFNAVVHIGSLNWPWPDTQLT